MGNAESAVVRNVDKRTSRREHRPTFEAAVRRFREAPFAAPAQDKVRASCLGRSVRVCVRKRPIFPHELNDQGEFDVITCAPGRVVVHDARMHPDMIHMFMNHHDFIFDEAFNELADNDMVYQGTAHELVLDVLRGRSATCMMYGQTGSGKTFTMTAIYERAARELFANVDGRSVTMCFVELLGDHCFDMFNQGAPCTLSTAADGSVHPYPSVEVPVKDASEFIALIDLATKLRATAATGVHDQSSRSHALCRIFIDGGGSDDMSTDSEGCLTLVDLAGSEHRIDNAEHNAERRKEGAKINSSLAALKECIRATAAGAKFVAFRQNRLTQLLRGCFVGADWHRTVVIATISPSSKDTEHSLNTLRHACIMDGQGEGKTGQGSHLAGGAVTKELLGEIDVARLAREKKRASKAEAPKTDDWGKPPPAHQAKQSNTAARAKLDERCVRALPSQVAQALQEARRSFGTERQRRRLSRAPPVAADAGAEACAEAPCDDDAAERSAPWRVQPPPKPRRSVPGEAADPSGATTPGGRAQDPSPRNDDGAEDMVGEGAAEHEKALALFRSFCVRGREARAWRKNDLRLINTFVVPLLYGTDTQLDWAHPNVALDELERLVAEMPPPPHLSGTPWWETSKSAAPVAADRGTQRQRLSSGAAEASSGKPARPPTLPVSAPEMRSRHSIGCPTGDRPHSGAPVTMARDRSAGARPGAVTPDRRASAAHPGAASTGNRSVSPLHRGSSPMQRGSDEGADFRGPVTHQDAIRARREALEQQRQVTLQKALNKAGKIGAVSRDEEIANLEQQLASSSCSAAAAVGLKKRLATLRAQAKREERASKWKLPERAVEADAGDAKPLSPPVQATSAGASPTSCHSRVSGSYSPMRGTEGSFDFDGLPAPARPPPRKASEVAASRRLLQDMSTAGDLSPANSSEAGQAALSFEGQEQRHQQMLAGLGGIGQRCAPARTSTGRRRPPAPLQMGAASAPWANDFSPEDGLTAQG